MKIVYVVVGVLTIFLLGFIIMPTEMGIEDIKANYEMSLERFSFLETDEEITAGEEEAVDILNHQATSSYEDDMFLMHFFTKHEDGLNIEFTSDFGYRICAGCSEYHDGVDLRGSRSGAFEKVIALSPGPGIVESAVIIPGSNQGAQVVIKDSRSNVRHVFYHVKEIYVEEGDIVAPGDKVALMGGRGVGPVHLHFQMHMQPDIDPLFKAHIIANSKYQTSIFNRTWISFDPQDPGIKFDRATFPESVSYQSGMAVHTWNLVDVPTANSLTESQIPEGEAEFEVRDGISYYNDIAIANKKHVLPADFNPGVSAEMSEASTRMISAMHSQIGKKLINHSDYRSYTTQTNTYANHVRNHGQEEADRVSAKPGHSEHQLGLAIDFKRCSDCGLETTLEGTEQFKWMVEHADEYGFILRYPKGKDSITGYSYEPWHWRYLGIEKARQFKESNKATLEEWLGAPGGDY